MKKIALVITCALFQGCISLAISPDVTGTVVSESGELIFAKVTITNIQLKKSKTVQTDKAGNYSLKKMRILVFPIFSAILLKSEISVRAKGYRTATELIDSKEPSIANFILVAE